MTMEDQQNRIDKDQSIDFLHGFSYDQYYVSIKWLPLAKRDIVCIKNENWFSQRLIQILDLNKY